MHDVLLSEASEDELESLRSECKNYFFHIAKNAKIECKNNANFAQAQFSCFLIFFLDPSSSSGDTY